MIKSVGCWPTFRMRNSKARVSRDGERGGSVCGPASNPIWSGSSPLASRPAMAHRLTLRERRERERKYPAEEEPEFQIAPMIDILLVLLVFFMSISSTEVL